MWYVERLEDGVWRPIATLPSYEQARTYAQTRWRHTPSSASGRSPSGGRVMRLALERHPHLTWDPAFSPREQFSASQLSLADDCRFAWGLRYLLGWRTPELEIETPDDEARGLTRLEFTTGRERSLLFGKLLHKRLERYYRGENVDWSDEVGQRALPGLAFLPDRSREPVRVEAPIQLNTAECLAGIEPLSFVGFVDLETPTILYDYKTTSNFRWMKTVADLTDDLAVNVYGLARMQRLNEAKSDQRWVYFASAGKPEARAARFQITRENATRVVAGACVQASGLREEIRSAREHHTDGSITDELRVIEHLPKNTANCRKYGGCPYHFSAGGPCQAEAAPGATLIPVEHLLDLKEQRHEAFTTQPAEGQQDMSNAPTLAERMAANRLAIAQQAPQPAQPAAPQGFNPNAVQFPGTPGYPAQQQFAPPVAAMPQPNYSAQPPQQNFGAPPQPAPTAPALGVVPPAPQEFAPPQFAPPTVPVGVAPAPHPAFGAPEQQAPAPLPFAGVNPPEQHLAAPATAPVAPAQQPTPAPAPKGRKAKTTASAPVAAPTVAGDGAITVFVVFERDNGEAFKRLADGALAEELIKHYAV